MFIHGAIMNDLLHYVNIKTFAYVLWALWTLRSLWAASDARWGGRVSGGAQAKAWGYGCGVDELIVGSEKLTAVYGKWPRFHDAEVIEVHLWRGEMEPEEEQFAARVLTVKVHVMQQAPTSREMVAVLRFDEVDDFRMEGFNHQNALLGIEIEERSGKEPGSDGPADFAVKFEGAFGMSASFTCVGIEVVEAE